MHFRQILVAENSPNIIKLIHSGAVEEYCMDLLPATEAKQFENEMEGSVELQNVVSEFRRRLSAQKKSKDLEAVWKKLEKKIPFDVAPVSQLIVPVLSRFTDLNQIRKDIEGITIPDSEENIVMVPFRRVLDFEQLLVRVLKFVPEETHSDLLESFFILEGSCTCRIGDKRVDMEVGHFLEIPLHVPHSVAVTSEKPVLAILQRATIY